MFSQENHERAYDEQHDDTTTDDCPKTVRSGGLELTVEGHTETDWHWFEPKVSP